MKVTYRTRDGRTSFEIEGSSIKDLFRGLSDVQEVFEPGPCGSCHGTDIRFRRRVIDDNEYFEAHCLKCRAALKYGQHKKGETLFAKHQAGWTIYNAEEHDTAETISLFEQDTMRKGGRPVRPPANGRASR